MILPHGSRHSATEGTTVNAAGERMIESMTPADIDEGWLDVCMPDDRCFRVLDDTELVVATIGGRKPLRVDISGACTRHLTMFQGGGPT